MDNTTREEEPLLGGEPRRRRSRDLRKAAIGAAALIVFLGLCLVFGHQLYQLVKDLISLSRNRVDQPTPSSVYVTSNSKNEFRLVSVHRAGIGRRKNQVYQVLDIPPESSLHIQNDGGRYFIPSTPRRTTHLANRSKGFVKNYMEASRLQAAALRDPLIFSAPQSPAAEWVTHDVLAPNVSIRNTVMRLAKVASNAYIRIPETEDWYDLGNKWNESSDFGWEENGLRGHVFANSDNSTIIVAMKGTSPPFVGGSDTSTNDKINVRLSKGVNAGQLILLLLLCQDLVYLVYRMRLLYWPNI
jgi:putative lipase involved disintegration of autophagic bodies